MVISHGPTTYQLVRIYKLYYQIYYDNKDPDTPYWVNKNRIAVPNSNLLGGGGRPIYFPTQNIFFSFRSKNVSIILHYNLY